MPMTHGPPVSGERTGSTLVGDVLPQAHSQSTPIPNNQLLVPQGLDSALNDSSSTTLVLSELWTVRTNEKFCLDCTFDYQYGQLKVFCMRCRYEYALSPTIQH
jgi:hypothetical protein